MNIPNDPDCVRLFDALIAAKKARTKGVRSTIAVSFSGRNPFGGKTPHGMESAAYLGDTSTHTWRMMSIPHSSGKADLGPGSKGRDYRKIVSRTPAKLEDDLFLPPPLPKMKEDDWPIVNTKRSMRHRMNGLSMHAPEKVL